MKRIPHWAALACAASAVLLSGCTADGSAGPDRWGPTATTTAAPGTAVQLAERYRDWGGMEEVHAIRERSGSGGSTLLVVWTDNPDTGNRHFEELKGSIIRFLQAEEKVSLDKGYLMDVFGPEGELLHRLDARHPGED